MAGPSPPSSQYFLGAAAVGGSWQGGAAEPHRDAGDGGDGLTALEDGADGHLGGGGEDAGLSAGMNSGGGGGLGLAAAPHGRALCARGRCDSSPDAIESPGRVFIGAASHPDSGLTADVEMTVEFCAKTTAFAATWAPK